MEKPVAENVTVWFPMGRVSDLASKPVTFVGGMRPPSRETSYEPGKAKPYNEMPVPV